MRSSDVMNNKDTNTSIHELQIKGEFSLSYVINQKTEIQLNESWTGGRGRYNTVSYIVRKIPTHHNVPHIPGTMETDWVVTIRDIRESNYSIGTITLTVVLLVYSRI